MTTFAHISDTHIRNVKYHEEYRKVFKDIYESLENDIRHLTNIIEILSIKKENTIMVGDSETDSEAAIQAKIKFILVAHGYTEKDEKNIKHDYLINDFNMIKGISEKLLKIK